MQLEEALQKITTELIIQHNKEINMWFKSPILDVFSSRLRRFLVTLGVTTCNAYFHSNGTPRSIFIKQLQSILIDQNYEKNIRVLAALWYVVFSCRLNPWLEMIVFGYLDKRESEDVIALKNTILQQKTTAIRYLHPILVFEENHLEIMQQLALLPSEISFKLEQDYAYFSNLLIHFSCAFPINIHLMLLYVGLMRGASTNDGATEENSGPAAKKAYSRFSHGLKFLSEQDLSVLKDSDALPIILSLRKGECVDTARENLYPILTDTKCLAALSKIFPSQENIQKTLILEPIKSKSESLESHIQQLLEFQKAVLLNKSLSIHFAAQIDLFLATIVNLSTSNYSPAKWLHNILYENQISESFVLTQIYIKLEQQGFKYWIHSLKDFQLLTTLFRSNYDRQTLNTFFIQFYSKKINSLEECCWIIRLLDDKNQADTLLDNVTLDINQSFKNLSHLKEITGNNEREFNFILSVFETQILEAATTNYNLDLFFEDIQFNNQLKILNISKNINHSLSFMFAYFGSITYQDESKFQSLIDFFSQGNENKLIEIIQEFHKNKQLEKISFISYEFICALLNHEKIKTTIPQAILFSIKEQFIEIFSKDENIVFLSNKEINSLLTLSIDYLLETNRHEYLIAFIAILDAGINTVNLEDIYKLFEYNGLFAIKNNTFWNQIFSIPTLNLHYKTKYNGILLEIAQRLACSYKALNQKFLSELASNPSEDYASAVFNYFKDNKHILRQEEAVLFLTDFINDRHNITKVGPVYEPVRFTRTYINILFFFAKQYPEPTIFELISKTVNEKIQHAKFESLELKALCSRLKEICKPNLSSKLKPF